MKIKQKRVAIVTMTLLLFIMQLVVFPNISEVSAAKGPVNLALGRTGEASSWGGSGDNSVHEFRCAMAFDGDSKTRWASWYDATAPNVQKGWLLIDFAEVHTIDTVEIEWDADFAKDYVIEVNYQDKSNAACWKNVFTETNGDGGTDTIKFSPEKAKWVRMKTPVGTTWKYSIREMRVFEPYVPYELNFAKGKYAFATTWENYNEGVVNYHITDDNMSTRWIAGDANEKQVVTVNLATLQQEPYMANEFEIVWEGAYAKSYEVQVNHLDKDNSACWTSVYKTTAGNGGTDRIKFDTQPARWIRLICTERGTQWKYSLYEFRVFGEYEAFTQDSGCYNSVGDEVYSSDILTPNSEITVKSVLTKNPEYLEEFDPYKVVFAQYKGGKLENFVEKPLVFGPTGVETISTTFTMPSDTNGVTFKTFIVKDLQNIEPISAAVSLPREKI